MVRVFVSDDESYGESQALAEIKNTYPQLDYDLNFARFDGFQDSLTDLVEEAQMATFSGDNKVLLLTNGYFLTGGKTKGRQTETDLQIFESYLQHPNSSTDIFVCLVGKLGSNPLAKALKTADFIDVKLPRDAALIGEGLRLVTAQGQSIDRESLQEVAKRVDYDYGAFKNALIKLGLYTDQIRLVDVETLVAPKIEDNVFAIADDLMAAKPLLALAHYRDLRRGGLDPLGFLPILFSQFRFMAQLAYYLDQGYSDEKTAATLNCKPGRVYMNKRKLHGKNFLTLIDIMAGLGRLEKNIKFANDDADFSLETFFLTFPQKFGARKR